MLEELKTLCRLSGVSSHEDDVRSYIPVSYTHLTLPTTPYV